MLTCEECGAETAEDSKGWRALHGYEEEDDSIRVAVFCPSCAEREFGPLDPNGEHEQQQDDESED